MVDLTERREYFRISVDCEIDYCFVDVGSDEIYQARCTTLSGAGISFITNQALQLEAELDITIQSQLPLRPPMLARAKVIRVRVLDDELFEVGASMFVLHAD